MSVREASWNFTRATRRRATRAAQF